MAEVLILDAEALDAIAHARMRGAAALRARAILAVAHERSALVRVPAPVIAEVCHGGAHDAAIDRVFWHVLHGRGIGVIDLDARIARRAGALLAAAKMSSANAVDAFVVATAALVAPAIIATHDPDDISRLASRERGVRVWPI